SRRRHTRSKRDWSSDVCSSDLCIAFSGLMILFSGEIHLEKDGNNRLLQIISLLCLVITGIYAGYFGAASGVLMLVILNAISDDNFLTVNAMKNIIGALSNLVAQDR